MNLELRGSCFPGSVVCREDRYGKDGAEFLERVFFISDGIMLQQIKDISGVDGSTLQNWVKRGWIGNTVNKKYTRNQLARILIINMLRSSMRLDRIDYLLRYINGTINCEDDDIIPEATLYGYICRIIDEVSGAGSMTLEELKTLVSRRIATYPEKVPDARKRLEKAMVIILTAYASSLMMKASADLMEELVGETERERRQTNGTMV